MVDDPFDLDRFLRAQAPVFGAVMDELRAGQKRSHWMWFVFPQVAGLGRSETARFYALANLAEARAYLADPVLGPRLLACTQAMLAWAGKRSAKAILGETDAMKFASSMTLFEAAGGGEPFARALDALCAGRRDAATLALTGDCGQETQ